MNNRSGLLKFSWIGPLIFTLAVILFGTFQQNYSHIGQYISELGADDAPYQFYVNYFGIVPFGISIVLYAMAGINHSRKYFLRKIAYIILLITGLLFVIAGLFNCDEGCSFENMSQESIIHNMSAFSAFVLSLLVQLLSGIISYSKGNTFTYYSLFAGILGCFLFYLISVSGIKRLISKTIFG